MRALFILSLFLLFFSCQPDAESIDRPTSFNRLPTEQSFTIDPTRDTVLFSEQGVRIFLPKACFLDSEQRIVTEPITIHFLEALTIAQRMEMGAAAPIGLGEGLGAFRLEARREGEMLQVNPEAPLVIQIPGVLADGDVQLVAGKSDDKGNIRWGEGRQSEKYLLTVPLDELAFHPPALRKELEESIPFGSFAEADLLLADSFYFSNGGDRTFLDLTEGFQYTDWNEAYYNTGHTVVNGQYTTDSYRHQNYQVSYQNGGWNDSNAHDHGSEPVIAKGIDPLSVAVLKDKAYRKTFVATTAFRERLQALIQIGEEELLHEYVDHLDEDLYQIDQRILDYLEELEHPMAMTYAQFASQQLTNTKKGARHAEALRKAFAQRKAALDAELEGKRTLIQQALVAKSQEVDELIEDYQQILWQREKDRMEAYTFTWTDVGWMWLHREREPATDTISMRALDVQVTNSSRMDEVQVYTIYPAVKSLYRLNTNNGGNFYVGNGWEQRMIMLEDHRAVVYAVGFKRDQLFLDSMTYNTDTDNTLSLELQPRDRRAFEGILSRYDQFGSANELLRDVGFQRRFAAERARQDDLYEQQIVLEKLYVYSFPNYYQLDMARAKRLFRENCTDCHSADRKTNLTGPSLIQVPETFTLTWFMDYTRNSQAMIKAGEPRAMKTWEEWGPVIMSSFPDLTEQELVDLYFYLGTD